MQMLCNGVNKPPLVNKQVYMCALPFGGWLSVGKIAHQLGIVVKNARQWLSVQCVLIVQDLEAVTDLLSW
jgi:hypothetical protein